MVFVCMRDDTKGVTEEGTVKRAGVFNNFDVSAEAYNCENVELSVNPEEKSLVVIPSDKENTKNILVCNRIGLYEKLPAEVNICLINEDLFMVQVLDGSVVVAMEDNFEPNGEVKLGLITEGEPYTGNILRSKIHWYTPLDLLSTLESIKEVESNWGRNIRYNAFNYIISISVECISAKDNHVRLRPMGSIDISLGKIDEEVRSENMRELTRMMNSAQVEYREEEPDDYDFEDDEDDDFFDEEY